MPCFFKQSLWLAVPLADRRQRHRPLTLSLEINTLFFICYYMNGVSSVILDGTFHELLPNLFVPTHYSYDQMLDGLRSLNIRNFNSMDARAHSS